MYDGTPGSVLFNLDAMRQRLRDAGPEAKAMMRTLNLMHEAGLLTLRLTRAESVARKVYELQIDRRAAESAWRWLAENGFLVIEGNEVVPTHAVYIESSFFPNYNLGDA